MTQNNSSNELMSAMLDGECDADQLGRTVKWLAGDAAARERLNRFCLSRDALRGELQVGLSGGFAERVRVAVDSEPNLLIPRQPALAGGPAGDAGARRWLKPAAGLAIAASVAMVSFIGLNQLQGERPAAGTLARQDTATAPAPALAGRAVPNGLLQTAVGPSERPAEAAAGAELRQRLNHYLLDHTEYARMGEMNGVVSYSRLVGYGRSR